MTMHWQNMRAARSAGLVYTADGVYRSAQPMTADQIAAVAPAALAVEAHESRSDRYAPIPTLAVVEALRRAVGVEVYGAAQARTREQDKRGHTKHVLRMRRPGDERADHAPELVLTNSYDGSSSYRLQLGCYRVVCANGLIVGEAWDKAAVRHTGDAIDKMVEETQRLAGQFDQIGASVESMRSLELSPGAQEAFARSAIKLRHDDPDEEVAARQVLRSRREADQGRDLWTTFNRVQESLTRGGYHKTTRDQHGRRQSRRVRPVTGIDGNSALNSALWTLAEEMERLAA